MFPLSQRLDYITITTVTSPVQMGRSPAQMDRMQQDTKMYFVVNDNS